MVFNDFDVVGLMVSIGCLETRLVELSSSPIMIISSSSSFDLVFATKKYYCKVVLT